MSESMAVACIGFVVPIIMFFLNNYQRQQERKERQEDLMASRDDGLREAVKAIMQNTINHIAQRHIKDEWIPPGELQNLISLYTPYKERLHGNGYTEQLMKKVMKLPNEPPKAYIGERVGEQNGPVYDNARYYQEGSNISPLIVEGGNY